MRDRKLSIKIDRIEQDRKIEILKNVSIID